MPNYLRLLVRPGSLKSLSMRYYNYETSGRALMGDTAEQPIPKHVFQYLYVPNQLPEQLGAMRAYHIPKDMFEAEHVFAMETWEHRYPGEQWNIGSLPLNILWYLSPLLLFLISKYEEYENSKRKGALNIMYYDQGGYCHGELNLTPEMPL